jgi:hypothetical protein
MNAVADLSKARRATARARSDRVDLEPAELKSPRFPHRPREVAEAGPCAARLKFSFSATAMK